MICYVFLCGIFYGFVVVLWSSLEYYTCFMYCRKFKLICILIYSLHDPICVCSPNSRLFSESHSCLLWNMIDLVILKYFALIALTCEEINSLWGIYESFMLYDYICLLWLLVLTVKALFNRFLKDSKWHINLNCQAFTVLHLKHYVIFFKKY